MTSVKIACDNPPHEESFLSFYPMLREVVTIRVNDTVLAKGPCNWRDYNFIADVTPLTVRKGYCSGSCHVETASRYYSDRYRCYTLQAARRYRSGQRSRLVSDSCRDHQGLIRPQGLYGHHTVLYSESGWQSLSQLYWMPRHKHSLFHAGRQTPTKTEDSSRHEWCQDNAIYGRPRTSLCCFDQRVEITSTINFLKRLDVIMCCAFIAQRAASA